jgi:hypothetical protein
MGKYDEIRNTIIKILDDNFGIFTYTGHGVNIGIWETKDFQDMEKPIGSSWWTAKYRLWVFIPDKYGMQIKVEMFFMSVYEWESMFEGYIEDVNDIKKILNYQLGLKTK